MMVLQARWPGSTIGSMMSIISSSFHLLARRASDRSGDKLALSCRPRAIHLNIHLILKSLTLIRWPTLQLTRHLFSRPTSSEAAMKWTLFSSLSVQLLAICYTQLELADGFKRRWLEKQIYIEADRAGWLTTNSPDQFVALC